MKKYKTFSIQVIFILACLPLMLGCLAHSQSVVQCVSGETFGFWGGLWHGLISPISWLCSLFSNVEIWAVNNNGGWYSFGFICGVGGFTSLLKIIGIILKAILNEFE